MQYCYGTTTLDTSGLTLAQLQQLLGALALPALPPLTPAEGAAGNATQQISAQSQTGGDQPAAPSGSTDGESVAPSGPGLGSATQQIQAATQSNTTVQVALGATGDGAGPTAVNQTGQGIWQLQIGCLFDCAGTQQLQQAAQSNTTVQAVGDPDAADSSETQIIWQLQIGCLFWCYDAVEGQTATSTSSTVVITPGPPADPAPTPTPSPVPTPTSTPSPAPTSVATPAGGDPAAAPTVAGNAPGDAPSIAPGPPAPRGPAPAAGVVGAALGVIEPAPVHRVLRGIAMSGGSAPATIGGGEAIVSVSATRSIAFEYLRPAKHAAHHHERHPRDAHPIRKATRTSPGLSRRAVVKPSGLTAPWLTLVLGVAAAIALAAGLWRRFGAR